MKPFLLLILFIIGVVVGMVIIPLLPDGVQRGISSFQLEIRYQVGLEERLGEMPLSSTPTPRPGETASLLSTSTPTPIPLPRIRVSPLHTPTPTPSSLPACSSCAFAHVYPNSTAYGCNLKTCDSLPWT